MDFKDPFIKTELKDHLNIVNLIKEICVDKREDILMFCPKCLKLVTFRKVPNMDYVTGDEILVYQCSECKKNFVEDAWNPNNSIERLITINDLIAPYQKDIQIMEMKDFDKIE